MMETLTSVFAAPVTASSSNAAWLGPDADERDRQSPEKMPRRSSASRFCPTRPNVKTEPTSPPAPIAALRKPHALRPQVEKIEREHGDEHRQGSVDQRLSPGGDEDRARTRVTDHGPEALGQLRDQRAFASDTRLATSSTPRIRAASPSTTGTSGRSLRRRPGTVAAKESRPAPG